MIASLKMTSQEIQKRYREKHREECRARCRAYYWKNHEAQKARGREKCRRDYEENREKILEKNNRWRLANLDAVKARQKQYHAENTEIRNARSREYHKKLSNDPDYKRAHSIRGKRNYRENKEHILKNHKKWMDAHPGIQRVYATHRRAREKAVTIDPASIKAWMLMIRSKKTAKCYYCGKVESSKKIHFEHIVPLIRGGKHAIENLCVSCKQCNLSKGTRKPDEWIKSGQQVFML